MARKPQEQIPIMVGGSRIGEIRIDQARAREAVEYLVNVAAPSPIAQIPWKRLLGYVLRSVRRTIHDGANRVVEQAVWRAVDSVRRPRRGRRKKVDSRELYSLHCQLMPSMIALCAALNGHRNRAAGWMAFAEKEPTRAKILDDQGFKAQLLNSATKKPTAVDLADRVLARAFNSTRLTVQKRRKEGARLATRRKQGINSALN